MSNLSAEQRQEFMAEWSALDTRDTEIEAARKPIDEQLRPFIDQAAEVEERREELIERYGAEFVGKCESCGKPLFSGDQGSHPYEDEFSIVYCAEHGLTYGDLRSSWSEPGLYDEDDERRTDALKMVDDHLAAGGALTDLCPTYEL